MAARVFVTIKGLKSGVFPGDYLSGPHKGEIAASSFSFELTSPLDASSGLPNGKRQYKPVIFTHSISAAAALVVGAATSNESLTTATFVVYKPNASGAEMAYYTVTLTNAHVASVRQYTVDGDPMEEVSLTFQKITMDVGGKTASDDWMAVR
ncbi:MAG TPA: type VI secretion system tube protein TssD [Gemmatimonadaceae bacterium]